MPLRQPFVIIITISRENEHNDGVVVDSVNEAMLLRDLARPLTCAVAFQRLGMPRAGLGMKSQFVKFLQQ